MKYIDWVKLWEKEGHIGVNIANLIDDWTEERNYQRRHRKWALGEAFFQKGRGNRLYKILKETVVELNKALSWQRERTEKAEAEIKELEGWNKKRINHIERLEEEGIKLLDEVKELKQTKEKQNGIK